MYCEMKLEIEREGVKEECVYYVTQKDDSEWGCVMYNVGIREGKTEKEIDDFSPEINEAKALCEYLYAEHISANNLFSAAEEFIERL